MKKSIRVLVILALAAIVACNPTTQPEQQNPGDFAADFSNTDGTPSFFDATNAKAFVIGSMYTVSGTQSTLSGTADLTVAGIPSSSSVPYTVTSQQSSTLKVSYHDPTNNKDYFSTSGGGSCTVSISQTSQTLLGTFTARLIATGADSVRQVTSASFNATIQ